MMRFAWQLLLFAAASPGLLIFCASPGEAPGEDTVMLADCSKTQTACLLQENKLLRQKLHLQRQQLGEMSCKADGIGPTGGFCLTKEQASVGGNDILDRSITAEMISLFQGKTVLDLGCGMGHYGKAFNEAGNIEWIGYDGAENVEAVTNGYVHFMDMTLPQWIGRKYDWVVSLEVGEHIPNESEDIFIDNIVRHAAEGVVLSWAVPGQPGHHHINTQPNEHLIAKMRQRGFSVSEKLTETFRKVAELEWFTRTILVYEKKTDLLSLPNNVTTNSALWPWLSGFAFCVALTVAAVNYVNRHSS